MNTVCPQCGALNAVHHRFCFNCGHALTPAGVPPAATLPQPGRWRAFTEAARKGIGTGWRASRGLGRRVPRALAFPGGVLAALSVSAGRAAHARSRIRPWEIAVVAALTFIAAVIRAQNLETVPPGIANDEAELALEALRVARGELWPGAWTGVTLGTPTGTVYLQALLFLLLDASIATARLSAALPGIALIPVAYLLMRELFSARTAVLTAAFVTFHVWLIALSRIAFPAMPAVFCFAAGIWLLIAGARSNRPWVAGLGGLLFGLGWYTYQAFPLYAGAVWGVLVFLLLLRPETRSKEVYWFLGASVAVSAHIAFLYLTSEAVASGFHFYDRTPLSLMPLLSRAWEVVTYVHTPMPREGNVGTGGIPLLHLSTEVFFWTGLATLLLSIRRRPSQLLLAGWLVSLVPAVLAPDAESRRYLLGIFFVLAIAAVGLDAVVSLAHNRWKKRAATLPIPILAGWFGNAVAALALGAFLLFFAAQQNRDYDDWLVGSEWALARKEVAAVRFAHSLGNDYEVRLYNDRVPSTSGVVQWFLSDAEVTDGSSVHGGSGGIDAESVEGPTVWLLSEDYLTLIPQLESTFPEGSLTFENSEHGELLYAAYVLDTS